MDFSDLADWLTDNLWVAIVAFFAVFSAFQIYRKNKATKKAAKKLQQSIDSQTNEPITLHPHIDPGLCAGCGNCVSACPEGKIIQIINAKAVLVTPTKCVGHGECERSCPTGAISLVFGTKTRGMEIPRISTNYETNVPGLYIAGELGGMGLIRNAFKQGNIAATHAIANIKTNEKTDTDLLIVGAGPAGLSCGFTAVQMKKSYICIEQNSVGGTVYNFPRQKIVMTHPADVPGVGQMKFKKNKVSKEELLEFFNDARAKTGLKIKEHVRFISVKKEGNIFHAETSAGIITAKKVILCMGVRGSPRKLGLPNEDTEKVAYNLIDPEQYQRKNIAVVGGGNAGVEAAQMLGNSKYQNKVTLLVRGPTFDRCNEENKNIIVKMAEKGLVEILYSTSVTAIDTKTIKIKTEGKEEKEIKNDYLFVFAGAEMPFKFLMSLGVEIEKKYGTR